MKTKNFLLTGALLIVALFSVNGVMAQSPAGKTGSTDVHIVLNPMQAITVNQTDVTLAYTSIDDYKDGVEELMKGHLTVHSVGPFTVRVKAGSDFEYKGEGPNDAIPASDVILTASAADGSTSPAVAFKPIRLGGGSTALISATSGGMNLEYDVNYSNESAGKDFKNAAKKGGTYTAQVTYEIFSN